MNDPKKAGKRNAASVRDDSGPRSLIWLLADIWASRWFKPAIFRL